MRNFMRNLVNKFMGFVKKSGNFVKKSVASFFLVSSVAQVQAAPVDMAPVTTTITENIPGLTGVGTAMVGLVVLVTIFAVVFTLLRR
jgi:hypothetical protein